VQERLPPGANLRVGPLTIPGPSRPATGVSGVQEEVIRGLATNPQTGQLDPNVAAGVIQRLRTNPQGADSRIFDIRHRQLTGQPVAPGELEAIEAWKKDLFGIAGARTGGGETGRLGVRKTPEFQQTETAIVAARQAGEPLPSGVQSSLIQSDRVLERLKEIEDNFDPKFLGPIRGLDTTFSARRTFKEPFTKAYGELSDKETTFRESLLDARDLLTRERSGAQVGERQEFNRIIDMLPKPTDLEKPFKAGLNRAMNAYKDLLAKRRKLGITPRGVIAGQSQSRPQKLEILEIRPIGP